MTIREYECPSCGGTYYNIRKHDASGFNDCDIDVQKIKRRERDGPPLTEDSEESGDPEEPDDKEYKGYKNRYTAYYGREWGEIRETVLDRDEYECQLCGITDEEHRESEDLFGGGLHIHHKIPAKSFDDYDEANDFSNLVALCANCHREAEV